jgi:hypothetical protein
MGDDDTQRHLSIRAISFGQRPQRTADECGLDNDSNDRA